MTAGYLSSIRYLGYRLEKLDSTFLPLGIDPLGPVVISRIFAGILSGAARGSRYAER